MISKETAAKIWHCHNEIEKANELFNKLKDELNKTGRFESIDAWGNKSGLMLGIPTSSSGHSLHNIPDDVVMLCIERHIEMQESKLKELKSICAIELRS